MQPLRALKGSDQSNRQDEMIKKSSLRPQKTFLLIYWQDHLLMLKKEPDLLILPQLFNDHDQSLRHQAVDEMRKLLGIEIEFEMVNGIVEMRGNKVRIATCRTKSKPTAQEFVLVKKEVLLFPDEFSAQENLKVAPLLRKTFREVGPRLIQGVVFI